MKLFGGALALPLASAATFTGTSMASEPPADLHTNVNSMNGVDALTIELNLDDVPTMKVTNNSSSLTILRRIHPGIAQDGEQTYNLNHALDSSFYAIRAGGSRIIPIANAMNTLPTPSSTALNARIPLHIATVADGINNVKSTQVYFA